MRRRAHALGTYTYEVVEFVADRRTGSTRMSMRNKGESSGIHRPRPTDYGLAIRRANVKDLERLEKSSRCNGSLRYAHSGFDADAAHLGGGYEPA